MKIVSSFLISGVACVAVYLGSPGIVSFGDIRGKSQLLVQGDAGGSDIFSMRAKTSRRSAMEAGLDSLTFRPKMARSMRMWNRNVVYCWL